MSMPDEEKLQYAPLTNLGCESEFAKLDNRVRVAGGMTSVSTHSKKTLWPQTVYLSIQNF